MVKVFFARLKSIFGPGKYGAQFGNDPNMEKLAMTEWAADIVRCDESFLADCLDYAKETLKPDTFICMTTILSGRPRQKTPPAWSLSGQYVCKGIMPSKPLSWHKPDFEKWGTKKSNVVQINQDEFEERKKAALAFVNQHAEGER